MRFNVSRLCGLVAACAVACALVSGMCLAANFSADMTTKMGGMTVTGKLYVSGSNARQNIEMQGRKQVVISRGDKHMAYMLNPAARQYVEMPGAGDTWKASKMSLPPGMTRKLVGKETINGIPCDKYVYTSKGKQAQTMTVCVAKDLDLPIKTEIKTPKGMIVVEYKNIKRGSSPASLFEIPKGYKKVSQSQMMQPKGAPKHK